MAIPENRLTGMSLDSQAAQRLLREVFSQLLHDPLATAARMETLAAELLEGARRLRAEDERLRSQGGLGDRVTIEVVRANS